ncbi:RNI-like protein [Calocera viscosa TUFC12733]|uniref:RNI-like protein n=1 Tax=Calocera viscosa (strain TUFC12733) TaxID=1330018 RepID=A0A167FPA9_CALVF|nr:RNI-like protein [Calocera viscosa TUFC12733]
MSVAIPVNLEIEYHEKRGRSPVDRHGRPAQKNAVKDDKKKKKRRWCIIIILIIIIIILATLGGVFGSRAAKSSSSVTTSSNTTVSNEAPIVTFTVQPTVAPVTLPGTTYLTTRTATVTFTTTPTPTPASTTATPSATPLSPALQSCLTQFQLSAPSNPLSYPCGTCASLVATLPNDLAPGFVASPTDPNTGGVSAGQLLQFCSLQTVFLASANSSSGSVNPLTSVGWMNNADPCSGWSGVTCDSTGRVTQLLMTFPAVPQTLSEGSMSGMVGMQMLQITGNGLVPTGSIPQSLLQLSNLVTLHLQTTGLAALPDNAFDALKALQQLTLAGNSNLGKTLPSSVTELPLTSLIVNGQDLQTDLTALLTSSAAFVTSLQTLDLSGNSLSSSLPSTLSAFTSLTDLNLSSNNLSSLPSMLPSSLKVLDMHQNSELKGTLPSQVCTMGLQSCDFKDTAVTASSCGVCMFGAS